MSKKKSEFDPVRIDACLDVIRQLYIDYNPQEITEAFIINRSEITAREERQQLEQEIELAQNKLKSLDTDTE